MLAAAGLVAVGPAGWIGRVGRRRWPWRWPWCSTPPTAASPGLQGTSSAFGRWLDQVLDELADMALHAAIAWAAFSRDGRPIWLAARDHLRLGEIPVPESSRSWAMSWKRPRRNVDGWLASDPAIARRPRRGLERLTAAACV